MFSTDPMKLTKTVPLAIPISYPRPDDSFFMKNYAPNEPFFTLPTKFLVENTIDLESLCILISDFLQFNKDISFKFLSTESIFSGIYLKISSHCSFRICVYRVKNSSGRHIIEGQRLDGDGFLFNEIYFGINKLFNKSADSESVDIKSAASESANIEFADIESADIKSAASESAASESAASESDVHIIAHNVIDMLQNPDSVLEGSKFACGLTSDPTIHKYLYSLGFVNILSDIVCRSNNILTNTQYPIGGCHWSLQHVIVALSQLACGPNESCRRDIINNNVLISTLHQINNLTLPFYFGQMQKKIQAIINAVDITIADGSTR